MRDPENFHFAEVKSQSGAPVLPEYTGDEYIIDFPPGARINYFYTPVLHPDTETVQMGFRRKANPVIGAPQMLPFSFRFTADPSWKGGAGSWEGVQKIEAAADYQ